MHESERMYRLAKSVTPGGVNSPVRFFEPYPVFARRARGAHIWDADGKRYLDMCCGYGALLQGHGHPKIISAVSRQLKTGHLYCMPTEAEVELASAICGAIPSVEMVRLVNTGAEATMTAIRLARGFTGKKKIIKFDGCYHGAHESVLVSAGSGAAKTAGLGNLGSAARETIVVPYNDIESFEGALSDEVAAVIVEPVPANMGLVVPKRGYLKKMERLTRSSGIVLIFDEIVTGFRMGLSGAQGLYNIRPDITTLGKALGGGFGIAAVGGKREIMELLSPAGGVYQASTFAGNPVSVSAALSAIHNLSDTNPYADLEKKCGTVAGRVRDAIRDKRIEATVNSTSSMMQVFFSKKTVQNYKDARLSDSAKFDAMFRGLLRAGIFVAPSRLEVAFLSTRHTGSDVKRVAAGYEQALMAL